MNDVFKVFLSLSLSGSLIILFLILCKHFWKDKISRQWQYYIWLIVIARLLLPFSLKTNLMGSLFQTNIVIQQHKQDNLQDVETASVPNIEQDIQAKRKPSIHPISNQPLQDITTLLTNQIWLVWLVIAFVLLIRKITVYQSFVNYVKAGQTFVSDIELLDRLSFLAEQTGMKKPVELCVNPLISSPLLIGFFRPYIVLPSTDISEKDFYYIVLHELTHYRRQDMFYKWLVQVTVCLHWFNPFIYIMNREINNMCEFSCDEAIITKLNYSNIQEYGKTLLNAMIKAGNYKESLASVTLNENKKMLKERLGAIMSFKKKSMIVKMFTAILTLGLCFSTTAIGAYATNSTKSQDIWGIDDEEIDQLPEDLENELRKDPIVREQLGLDDTEEQTSSSIESKEEHNIANKENMDEKISNSISHIISFDGTDINNVVISGENLGIVIEKSLTNSFELDYIGVEDINKFSIEYLTSSDATLTITVLADSSINYISTDPDNKINVVNIKIPEKLYDSITLNIHKGGLFLPNIQGNVNIYSEKSLIKVVADQFETNFKLNLKKSSLNFNVTGISNNINVIGTDTGNSVNLLFHDAPINLKLDATKCKGSVILPDGWSTDYKIGTNTPIVNLDIKGSTTISIK